MLDAVNADDLLPNHVLDNLLEGCQVIGFDYRYLYVNDAVDRQGRKIREQFAGQTMMDVYPGIEKTAMFEVLQRCMRERNHQQMENQFTFQDGSKAWFELRFIPVPEGVAILSNEIAKRKQTELEAEIVVGFLRMANECTSTRNLVARSILFFHDKLGFEAVGIRLQEGDDFPYYETRGFSEDFVLRENSLCDRDARGSIILDSNHHPILDCMCGNVIRGRFDPAKPFFTSAGNFWTNSTTELLASTTEKDRQAHTRNRCNGEGYESMAVIALRSSEGCIGLLQLNDHRRGQFTPESLALYERLAAHLAVALAKTRAEEAERSSEHRYRSLFNNAVSGIAYCRMLYESDRPADFIYLETNPAFEKLTGLSKVTGRKVSEIIPGIQASDPKLFEIYGRVAQGGLTERFEMFVEALDEWFDVSVYSPQKDHFVAIFDVISRRKHAENELIHFSDRIERLAQVVQDLSQARTTEEIVDIARKAARTLASSDGTSFIFKDGDQCHYMDEDAIGPLWKGKRFPMTSCISGWVMLHKKSVVIEDIYQDDRIPHEAYRPTFVKSMAMVPIRADNPIGAIGNYWARKYRASDEDLRILQALADATSVALENVRVLGELEKSERRYRELVENLDDVVFSFDVEGRFVYVSPAIAKYGYTVEEFHHSHFSQFVHPDDLPIAMESFGKAMAGEVNPVEFRAFEKSGKIRYLRASGRAVIENGDCVGMAGVLIDQTDRRNAEEQLRLAQRLESVGLLAGGVAHDFNNLLSVIAGYTEFVKNGMHEEDPLKKDLDEVLAAGRRAEKLTHQLLAFSRKQVLKPEVLDMNGIIQDMSSMLMRLLGEDINLIFKPGKYLGKALADPGQIEQVVMNLAVNARDAMPQGGKLILETTNIELDEDYSGRHTSAKPGHYVLLSVSDTGEGMDEQTKTQIFQPFFTTKPKGKGTGLGLSTVYGIVKQSGGNIWAYSELGLGTTFKIYLPRVTSIEETIRRPAREENQRTGSETILLVEDEASVRNLAKRILISAGYTVFDAACGSEAIAIYEQHAS